MRRFFLFVAVLSWIRFVANCFCWLRIRKCTDTRYKMTNFYLCIRKILFVAQIKFPRGSFICAQIEGSEYTNRGFLYTWKHGQRGTHHPRSFMHTQQHTKQDEPLLTLPPPALPSLSTETSSMDPDCGAVAHHEPNRGARRPGLRALHLVP